MNQDHKDRIASQRVLFSKDCNLSKDKERSLRKKLAKENGIDMSLGSERIRYSFLRYLYIKKQLEENPLTRKDKIFYLNDFLVRVYKFKLLGRVEEWTYLLIFNENIYIYNLDSNLICLKCRQKTKWFDRNCIKLDDYFAVEQWVWQQSYIRFDNETGEVIFFDYDKIDRYNEKRDREANINK